MDVLHEWLWHVDTSGQEEGEDESQNEDEHEPEGDRKARKWQGPGGSQVDLFIFDILEANHGCNAQVPVTLLSRGGVGDI